MSWLLIVRGSGRLSKEEQGGRRRPRALSVAFWSGDSLSGGAAISKELLLLPLPVLA